VVDAYDSPHIPARVEQERDIPDNREVVKEASVPYNLCSLWKEGIPQGIWPPAEAYNICWASIQPSLPDAHSRVQGRYPYSDVLVHDSLIRHDHL